jgi:hypothetical protein
MLREFLNPVNEGSSPIGRIGIERARLPPGIKVLDYVTNGVLDKVAFISALKAALQAQKFKNLNNPQTTKIPTKTTTTTTTTTTPTTTTTTEELTTTDVLTTTDATTIKLKPVTRKPVAAPVPIINLVGPVPVRNTAASSPSTKSGRPNAPVSQQSGRNNGNCTNSSLHFFYQQLLNISKMMPTWPFY